MQAEMWKLRRKSKGTLAIIAVLLFYVLLSFKRSEVKPMWFDELGTLNVATQPTWAGMFRVEPADGNPPLQYLLVRPSLHAFGVKELPLRLPALAGVGLALVCAYVFVGRRYGPAAGLVAPTLLVVSRVSDYGVDARPYGLLMGLTMLALVLWQRAAAVPERRTGTLAGLAVTVFCLVIAQPMGLLWAALPLLAGEATRWKQTRRADRAVLLSIGMGLTGFAVTLFFGRATQRMLSAESGQNHSAIALPTLVKFLQAFQVEGMLPAIALLLLLGSAALWARKRLGSDWNGSEGAPVYEWAAVAAFAMTVFAVFCFTELVTHYFWARYIVPGAVGWFVLVGMCSGSVQGIAGGRAVAAAAVLVGLFLIGWERRGMVATTVSSHSGTEDSVTPSLLSQGDPRLPIVVGKPFFFPQIWWYGPPSMRRRLHTLADAQTASTTSDFVPELTLIAMHDAGSRMFAPDAPSVFLEQNKRFLLWHHTVPQGCWQEDYLRARGYTFRTVASSATGDEVLYEVQAPGES